MARTKRYKDLKYSELYQLYVVEKKSTTQIAKILGVSDVTVGKYLRVHGIEIRSDKEARQLAQSKHIFTYTELYDLYITQEKSQEEIGRLFGISQTGVAKWLRRLSIPARNKTETHVGRRNGMYGKTHDQGTREKLRELNHQQFSKPGARERHGEITAQQIASGRTGIVNSKLEQAVEQILIERGIPYQKQFRIGRYVFDFYLPEYGVLLEAHGRFWHGDPRFYKVGELYKIQIKNIENDKRKRSRAIQSGYKVVCWWEDDVHNDKNKLSVLVDSYYQSVD